MMNKAAKADASFALSAYSKPGPARAVLVHTSRNNAVKVGAAAQMVLLLVIAGAAELVPMALGDQQA